MATFASLIAPFGGFFASGLKRTFKIKDFGDLVPGHGGITGYYTPPILSIHVINPCLTTFSDRMDCQFIMGFFSYMYYQSFIAVNQRASVGGILETAITSLSPEEQLEVVERLGRYLVGQGIVGDKVNLLPPPHPRTSACS